MEQFANEAGANLDGSIDSITTTVVVKNTVNVPASGVFRARVDSEYLKVTAVSGLTWTVTRGDGGTTAAAHNNNAAVALVVTKEAVDSLVSIRQAGTEISTRRVLNFTGATVTDDGANGQANIVIATANNYEAAWTAPSGSFVWLNQGTATVTTNANGSVYVFAPAISGNNGRGYMIACPATPYTVTFRLALALFEASANTAGVAFGDSGNSKFHTLARYQSNLQVNRLNYTGYVGTDVTANVGTAGNHWDWYRLKDDGTNRSFWVSVDGLNWVQVYSTARTTFITPTHVGVYAESNNGTWPVGVNLHSFKVTSP